MCVYIYVLYILAVPPLRIQAGYGPGRKKVQGALSRPRTVAKGNYKIQHAPLFVNCKAEILCKIYYIKMGKGCCFVYIRAKPQQKCGLSNLFVAFMELFIASIIILFATNVRSGLPK